MRRGPRRFATTATICLVILALLAVSRARSGPPRLAADPVPITKATVSPEIPTEVVDGAGVPLPVAVSALPIDFFDDFSWRSFLALNWPAKPDVRGEPDTSTAI